MRDRKVLLSIVSDVVEKSLYLGNVKLKENAKFKHDFCLNDFDIIELFVSLDIQLRINLSERYLHHFIDDDIEIYNLIDILEWIPEAAGSSAKWKVEAAHWLATIRKMRKSQKEKNKP